MKYSIKLYKQKKENESRIYCKNTFRKKERKKRKDIVEVISLELQNLTFITSVEWL